MPLSNGTRFGSYEILAPLGAVGEVYRAHDTKLGRAVALKVLYPALAGDAYMARFTREAQALAQPSQHRRESVVTTKPRTQSRLSSCIIRSTRLWFTWKPRCCSSNVILR